MAAKAEVRYDPSMVLPEQVASSITELGFPTSVMEESGAGQGEVDLEVSDKSELILCSHLDSSFFTELFW